MRYVEARLDEYKREEAYRIFVAESIRLAPQGKAFSRSYLEFVKPHEVDTRSGDDIASDIIAKAGLFFED